jgi:electron-transferring-flavoprotein dehydrogenase
MREWMMDIERDEMEVGVLFVGAGPATLAAAIRLMDQIEAHNEKVEKGEVDGEAIDVEESPIMIIEKGAEIGDQILSGACIDTRPFFELFSEEFLEQNPPPFNTPVTSDALTLLVPPSWGTPEGAGFGNMVFNVCAKVFGFSKMIANLMGFGSVLAKLATVILGTTKSFNAPVLPPTFQNHGNYLASLNEVVKWMAEIAEEKGVMIMPEFPGADLLIEDGQVVGVRTGDKGVDKHGQAKGNFEPGTDIKAKLTVLGEGARGSLTKLLIKKYKLDKESNHQIYSTGVKELWTVKPGRIQPGEVIHTAGYPLDGNTFGGGFIYGLNDNQVALGLVTALDSPDPYLDPHRKFNEWKSHPFVHKILKDGELVRYGAKTIPEGGWFSMPRPYAPGAILVGDSAGFVNISRLKGIHLAMKSGMLAAETAFEILQSTAVATEEETSSYYHKVLGSWLFQELWDVRNFRQGFQKTMFGGRVPGMITGTLLAGSGFITAGCLLGLGLILLIAGSLGVADLMPIAFFIIVAALLVGSASLPLGAFPLGRLPMEADHERMQKIDIGGWSRQSDARQALPQWREPGISAAADQVKFNEENSCQLAPARPIDANAPAASVNSNGVQMDKVTSVYHSGSAHEEDQPAHLIVVNQDVCHTRCAEEYGNPCQYFCPASVYEMVEASGGKSRKLQLNFSNCIHCKTCDVRDPYQIITWVPPEGGGGPSYSGL